MGLRSGARALARAAKVAVPAVAVALALGACSSGNDNPSIGGGSGGVGSISEVAMAATNGGQSGTATLSQDPNLVLTVTVKLPSAPSTVQEPAAIHAGTCAKFTPAAKFALSSVANGQSVTSSLKSTLAELSSSPYVIVVQRSGTDSTTVSCGPIPSTSATP